MSDSIGVSEPVVVLPVFCDGLHQIEIDRHNIARLTLYADQRESHDGSMQRVVVARLILPGAVVGEIAARMLGAPHHPAAGLNTALLGGDFQVGGRA